MIGHTGHKSEAGGGAHFTRSCLAELGFGRISAPPATFGAAELNHKALSMPGVVRARDRKFRLRRPSGTGGTDVRPNPISVRPTPARCWPIPDFGPIVPTHQVYAQWSFSRATSPMHIESFCWPRCGVAPARPSNCTRNRPDANTIDSTKTRATQETCSLSNDVRGHVPCATRHECEYSCPCSELVCVRMHACACGGADTAWVHFTEAVLAESCRFTATAPSS